MTNIEALAPYPRAENEVTADLLSRWLTVTAYHRQVADVQPARKAWEAAGTPSEGPERDMYLLACQAFTAEYAVAFLLRELPMSRADRLAVEVWRVYDGETEAAFEDLGAWLLEDGVDPEAILEPLLGPAGVQA